LDEIQVKQNSNHYYSEYCKRLPYLLTPCLVSIKYQTLPVLSYFRKVKISSITGL
jgi:hypothetical protein